MKCLNRRILYYLGNPCGLLKGLHLDDSCIYITHNIDNIKKQSIKTISTYHYKYSSVIETSINKQIQIEQQAAQDYLNLAVIFLHPCQNRAGTGGFFMRMYQEELRHMQYLIYYQLKRGGTALIGTIKAPTCSRTINMLDAFKQALDMEKRVTESLEDIVNNAEDKMDYQCADFITSKFLSEQFSSIDELTNHIVNLTRLSDSEHALYYYDLKLAKLYPYVHPPVLKN